MRCIRFKSSLSLIVMTIWLGCSASLVHAADLNPPQSLTKTDPSHEGRTGDAVAVAAESVAVLSAAYLAPAQYIAIEVAPADGHSFSKGYGINNRSQVVGRTYNYNAQTEETEDQRALFWDMRTGSRALSTLDGTSGGWGLNDTGMASGFSTNADGHERAVRWNLDDDSILDLGTLANPNTGVNGNQSYGYMGLNNAHTVIGHSEIHHDADDYTPFHGFIYDDTNGMRDLGTLTTDSYYLDGYSIAYDITETNVVVGLAHAAGWVFRAFIWSEGDGMTELAVDSARASGEWYATSINESGLIGGHAIEGNGYYPYYWPSKDDPPVAVSMPEAYPYGEVYSVNENGQMVGGMFNDAEEDRAFIFDSTNGLVNLNDRIDTASGWQLLVAVDINDMGQITGHGELNGEKRAFVLTPSADTDADGDIDGSDIAALVQEVGACSGSDCSCDFNGDEAVNNMDVLLQAMLLGHTS